MFTPRRSALKAMISCSTTDGLVESPCLVEMAGFLSLCFTNSFVALAMVCDTGLGMSKPVCGWWYW